DERVREDERRLEQAAGGVGDRQRGEHQRQGGGADVAVEIVERVEAGEDAENGGRRLPPAPGHARRSAARWASAIASLTSARRSAMRSAWRRRSTTKRPKARARRTTSPSPDGRGPDSG